MKSKTPSQSLCINTEIVLPNDTDIINVIGDMAGVLPLKDRKTPVNSPEPRKRSNPPKRDDGSDEPIIYV